MEKPKCEICGTEKRFRKAIIKYGKETQELKTWVYMCKCPEEKLNSMNPPKEPMVIHKLFDDKKIDEKKESK